MIQLRLEVDKEKGKVLLNLPDTEEEKLSLKELAVFNLYVDLVKKQVEDLFASSVIKAGGYDISIKNPE